MNMLEMVRRQLSEGLSKREALLKEAREVETTVEARGADATPTVEELEKITGIRSQIAEVDTNLGELRTRETDLVAQADADKRAEDEAKRLAALRGTQPPTPTEPRGVDKPDPLDSQTQRGSIYRHEARQESWLRDAMRAHEGDSGARERIIRSNKFEVDEARSASNPITVNGDEVRASDTDNFGNFIPPAYMLGEAALAARAGAPLLNRLRKLPLPSTGMTINLGRVTTPTVVAMQASQNTAPTSTDFDETDYNVDIRTATGETTLTRQAVDRGAVSDELVLQDLVEAYYDTLDVQVISGSGSSGQHTGLLNVAGINAVTYTDASPTGSELWPKLGDAAQQVGTNRKQPLDLWVLHTRRWEWLTVELDSQGRPLINVNGPGGQNVIGEGGVARPGGGYTLKGVEALQDPNVPIDLGGGTNEDRIIGLRVNDSPFFWENGGVPRMFRFDQLRAESIDIAVWGYSAFAPGRYPTGISVISGNGLATPSF